MSLTLECPPEVMDDTNLRAMWPTGSDDTLCRSAARVRARLRAIQAVQMRAEGHSLAQIAYVLKYNSEQAVHAAVKSALKREAVRVSKLTWWVEMNRIDSMIEALSPRARANDTTAINNIMKLFKVRRELFEMFGIPERVHLT